MSLLILMSTFLVRIEKREQRKTPKRARERSNFLSDHASHCHPRMSSTIGVLRQITYNNRDHESVIRKGHF